MNRLIIPNWCLPLLKHFKIQGPTGAGISGGRTSAMMHALTLAANPGCSDYQGCFGNTGKEDEMTLNFLFDIDEYTGIPLWWLEFLPPETLGDPPRMARFQHVTFETAHRGGRIFEDFLKTLAAYRAFVKDEGPVAPHVTSRICTSYMKLKTIHRALRQHFGDTDYTYMVGLRADEPSRVAKLMRQSNSVCTLRCPLYDAGITKQMVLDFWKAQPFDLELEEPRGNCSLCFLKDEGDLAMLMLENEEDTRWWLDIQERYGDFRRGQTTMRTIFAEAKVRLQVIRPAVLAFEYPTVPPDFTAEPFWLQQAKNEAEVAYQRRLNAWEEKKMGGEPDLPKPKPGAALSRTDEQWARYRWELLVKQEQRLAREGRRAFSCACESAQMAGALED